MIYFIQAGEAGPVKIGYARDVFRRMVKMQADNHCALRLLGTGPGEVEAERRLQAQFMYAHIRGEWFSPEPELLALAASHTIIDAPRKRVPAADLPPVYVSKLPRSMASLLAIESALKASGLSVAELCRQADINQTTWVKWKNEDRAIERAQPRTWEAVERARAVLLSEAA